jgi:catechol 2,3-dioxygenase-like lactoylglutathione lyase family enzyme
MTPHGSATLFMVRDLDRSLAFYKDVLGLTGGSEQVSWTAPPSQ